MRKNGKRRNGSPRSLESLRKLRGILQPSSYLETIFDEFYEELRKFLNPEELALMDKLYSVVESDYRNQDRIGKGYHCLEHNLELANLILKAWNYSGKEEKSPDSLPPLDRSQLLEMAVAALLHDYDPQLKKGTPKVDRTIYSLWTDDTIQGICKRMNLNFLHVALLIERTDYPFAPARKAIWESKIILNFSDELSARRFIRKAEMLSMMDKASTYYSLVPEEAHKRVEGLAEEVMVSRDKILSQTYWFFKRENVRRMARYLPENKVQKWNLVRRYFALLSRAEQKRERLERKPQMCAEVGPLDSRRNSWNM